MTNIITMTDAAAMHIKSMLAKNQNAIGFRLSIKKTGCSGYAYVPEIIEQVNEKDIHFVCHDDLAVYVDSDSANFISGLMIDYVAETDAGIKQKRLVYINPNEKNRCGCGESFTL